MTAPYLPPIRYNGARGLARADTGEYSVNDIEQFTNDIILGGGGLHAFEDHEMAVPNVDRDVAVAAWTIRCLANPHNDLSQAVLDAIIERREKVLASELRGKVGMR